jgi:hypothetical protein
MKNIYSLLLFTLLLTNLVGQSYCVPTACCFPNSSPEISSIAIYGNINGVYSALSTGSLGQGCGVTSLGYSDLSQNTFQGFDAGQSIQIDVNALNTGGQQQGTALNVWIYFNNDGDFNDAGECVINSNPTSPQFWPSSISIPNTVCHLQKTRIRIRLRYNNIILPSESCAGLNTGCTWDGETEDWSISFNNPSNQMSVAVSPTGSLNLCQGTTANLTASGAQNYVWSTGQTGNSISVNSTGSYFAVGSTAMGCKDTSNVVSVQVNPLPQISISAADPLEFCEGESVTLTASGGVSYQWSTGQSGPSVSIQSTGNVSAVGTDANGCQGTSNTLSINVVDYPQISSQPSSFQGAIGDQAIFTVQANAQNYQWQWRDNGVFQNINDGGQYLGTTTNELKVSNLIALNHNSFFRCVLSNGDCNDTSNNVKIMLQGVGFENNGLSQISIAPNPATSTLTLNLKDSYLGEVNIVDLYGRIVQTNIIQGQNAKIDISNLSSGIYILKLHFGSVYFIKV